eukprot:scaffold957_cov402-Prasinococcus_capsulatus_cf.AAC.24
MSTQSSFVEGGSARRVDLGPDSLLDEDVKQTIERDFKMILRRMQHAAFPSKVRRTGYASLPATARLPVWMLCRAAQRQRARAPQMGTVRASTPLLAAWNSAQLGRPKRAEAAYLHRGIPGRPSCTVACNGLLLWLLLEHSETQILAPSGARATCKRRPDDGLPSVQIRSLSGSVVADSPWRVDASIVAGGVVWRCSGDNQHSASRRHHHFLAKRLPTRCGLSN